VDESVSPLVARRLAFIAGLIVVSALTFAAWRLVRTALRPDVIYTGILLFLLILGLALFNARKKLPFLPLIKAATWLQIHIYAGWFCLFVFLLHIRFQMPSGTMEIVLAAIFCIVILSGAFGLYISRNLPARMTASGETLLYERIPGHRLRIQRSVEDLIRKAESETQSSTLGDFYVQRLRAFFSRVPSAISALASAERGLHALLAEMDALDRYLDEQEKKIAGEIRDWIETKQNLDFQYAAQRLLKLWLFVHIPVTYSLILLGAAHGIIAMLYAGRF
jgi:hypothetical protein